MGTNEIKESDGFKIISTLLLIQECSRIDGGHHKQWVLDQVVRILAGDLYDAWVQDYQNGEDGPNTYEWDVGIAL